MSDINNLGVRNLDPCLHFSFSVRVSLFFIFILIALGLSKTAFGQDFPWRTEDLRPGYVTQSSMENEDTGEVLYFIENPYKNEIQLSEIIFDSKMSEEIVRRYREQFGRTEAEIIYERTPFLNNNFTENDSFVFNEEEYLARQRKFGEFIMKRLVEYHFDTKAKNDPTLKVVYETKQKVEKVDVSFNAEWKLRLKYRLSSNNLNLTLKNPYADFNTRIEMSGGKDIVLTLNREFKGNIALVTDYYIESPKWDLIFRKGFENGVSTTFSYTPIREIQENEKTLNEQIYLVGVGLPF